MNEITMLRHSEFLFVLANGNMEWQRVIDIESGILLFLYCERRTLF